MSQLGIDRYSTSVICLLICFLLQISCNLSLIMYEINEAVFLNPNTNSATIRCPLNVTRGADIQWFNVFQQRYERNRGRYYRITGLQPFHREMICSGSASNGPGGNSDQYKFIIRTYDRPLPVRNVSISEVDYARFTVQWSDDSHNQKANISFYDLILTHNNIILHRSLVNHTSSSYVFFALQPNTVYTVDISAVDSWKRASKPTTITGRTLPLTSNANTTSHQIIDTHLLSQSITCYRLNQQLLLVEFNRSKLYSAKHIYNLTLYDQHDHLLLTDHLYSSRQLLPTMKALNSFLYQIKPDAITVKIKLLVSADQSEYLGSISKSCENFYPVYSPLTCSMKSTKSNIYHLTIHMQLFSNHKYLTTLKPIYVYYSISRNHAMKRQIHTIDKYVTADVTDVKGNYSIVVENDLVDGDPNNRLNISVLCSITRTVSIKRTNRVLNGAIIVLVVLIVCLATIASVIAYQRGLLRRYTYSLRKTHRSRSSLVQMTRVPVRDHHDEFHSAAVPLNQFASHVASLHKDDDFGFIRLFEDICESSKTDKFSADISQRECNKSKNRYINILTYDHSRVKLSSTEKDGRDNYINANYVDGYEKTNAYIATQGPMMNTINDFWRMIWEEDVSVLVMITNIKESGRVKCDIYWPDESAETYGNIQVTPISMTPLAYYVKRVFAIRCRTNGKFVGSERLIHHFHYTNWPDHGVPLFTLPVLSFIRHSSSCNPESGGPIVVHCSAGVGRTGTYIVIDTMLKKVAERQPLNIPSFLNHIRHQRNFLVQTEEQFVFIYDVLLEAVNLANIGCYDLDLTAQNCHSVIEMLNYYDKVFNLTRIEKQFQLIGAQSNEHQLIAGQLRDNLAKNRTQAILPFDATRVMLPTEKRQKDGGYINASYFHGYHRVDEFIVTQHPLVNTRIDFWQMIWHTHVEIIVSLYGDEKSQTDVPEFWPSANRLVECGTFSVYLLDEQFECEYIYRDFLLKSFSKENHQFRVKQISVTYWPDSCSPIDTSFHLINTIRNIKTDHPIVVHDLFGGFRAATFCALYTMNEQVENERILNVYELAKLYHTKRPNIWRHHGDLLFLYRSAEILFRDYDLSIIST